MLILENKLVVEPAEPVKNGYLFEGWLATKDSTDKFDISNKTITGPTRIYARWKPDDKLDKYEVTIEVYLDGEKWTDNGSKTFALKAKDSEEFIRDLNAVADGQFTAKAPDYIEWTLCRRTGSAKQRRIYLGQMESSFR